MNVDWNAQERIMQSQQECFAILRAVYGETHPVTLAEIGQAINQPVTSALMALTTQLMFSGHLQTQAGEGTVYYARPSMESLGQPRLPLPYFALDWF